MSYQLADGVTTVQFVRPVHGVVALHGANIVAVHALGLAVGAQHPRPSFPGRGAGGDPLGCRDTKRAWSTTAA